MRVFTEQLTATGVLTGYVQDASDELPTAAVRPAVLVLPGGGYRFCSDREAEPVALAYLAEGFNAFVLRYAVGPQCPIEDALADGVAALGWIRGHASDLAIDPQRVAAVGFSAGGHLAASLGTLVDERPDALVLGYPVTLPAMGEDLDRELPDLPAAVTAQTPPTFLFSTQGDEVVPIENSLAFLSALAAHGAPFEAHVYLLGPHGISLAKPLTASGRPDHAVASVSAWLGDSVRFLHDVLGDFALDGDARGAGRGA